jgi:hypothetical protein
MFVSKLFKKGFNTLGAPKHKTIVSFIDDLNIPIFDKFGDQPPLELLRFINENCKQLLLLLIFQVLVAKKRPFYKYYIHVFKYQFKEF